MILKMEYYLKKNGFDEYDVFVDFDFAEDTSKEIFEKGMAV